MTNQSTLMRKVMVFVMALAVMVSYAVLPTNQVFAASAKKPAQVKSLKAEATTTTAIKLTWKKAKNAKKYQVYVATKKKGKYTKIATVKSSKKTYTVKKYNKSKKLKANTKYYFKVRAINGKKKGKFSKIVAKKTMKKAAETEATLGEAKTATMSTYIDMSKYDAGKVVKVWVPVPQDDEYQKIENISYEVSGDATAKLTTESANGNKMLYIEWGKDTAPADRKASLLFTATRYEVKRDNLKEKSNVYLSAEAKKYLNKESSYVKVKDSIVQEYALKATKGKKGTLAKARAIYEWTIANLERIDDGETLVNAKGSSKTFKVEGCGYGDTVQILTDLKKFGRAGGHCTDINSTFVALCRAAGIPAREMFGIRMNEDATGGQHCWTEFYLPGTGWVYADPGDVLKAIKPGTGTTLAQMKTARASDTAKEKTAYFWGGVDNNRIVLARGRDITFNPAQSWGTCNTFGYPAAEVDGKRLDDFTNAKEFVYKIDCLDYTKLTADSDTWKKLGIEYKDLDLTNDVVIDVRTAENYAKGHIVGSTNIPDSTDKAALKEQYDAAKGKRIVLVCNSGQSLARNAMQALKMSGAYMPNVTYLIGGAKGFIDETGVNKAYKNNFGIPETEISGTDVLVDLRNDELYGAGHFKGSMRANVQANGAAGAAADLDAAYAAVTGDKSRLVLVCIKGHGLAKQAMAYYQSKGVDLTKVTYLIGGATGVSDTMKASEMWEK